MEQLLWDPCPPSHLSSPGALPAVPSAPRPFSALTGRAGGTWDVTLLCTGEHRGWGTFPKIRCTWWAEHNPAWAASGSSPSPASPTCLSPVEKAEVPQPQRHRHGGPHPSHAPCAGVLGGVLVLPGHVAMEPHWSLHQPLSVQTMNRNRCLPRLGQCRVAGSSRSPSTFCCPPATAEDGSQHPQQPLARVLARSLGLRAERAAPRKRRAGAQDVVQGSTPDLLGFGDPRGSGFSTLLQSLSHSTCMGAGVNTRMQNAPKQARRKVHPLHSSSFALCVLMHVYRKVLFTLDFLWHLVKCP